jgi:hypothetical protein
MPKCVRHWACICRGSGKVEDGPAGATYSVPCPGPPDQIWAYGIQYIAKEEESQDG